MWALPGPAVKPRPLHWQWIHYHWTSREVLSVNYFYKNVMLCTKHSSSTASNKSLNISCKFSQLVKLDKTSKGHSSPANIHTANWRLAVCVALSEWAHVHCWLYSSWYPRIVCSRSIREEVETCRASKARHTVNPISFWWLEHIKLLMPESSVVKEIAKSQGKEVDTREGE